MVDGGTSVRGGGLSVRPSVHTRPPAPEEATAPLGRLGFICLKEAKLKMMH